ncbi:MAG TPA: cytochrome c [Candidatus Acidoferrales bacterium]|nr:cytochrome c [Candidatus Acidoferrales bacterium]
MKHGRGFGRAFAPCAALVFAAALALVLGTGRTNAHTPVTSRFDYNKDVFPRLRDHCAACHVPGGAAPMSLVTYAAAMPWAESIRDELTAGRMPPWPVDPTSPAVKGGDRISPGDIDVIVVWASGGTPESYTDAKPAEVSFHGGWKLGPPDLKIPMNMEHTVGSSITEEVSDFSLSANVTDAKWVKAADLLPGNASIVRDAVISIENGPVLALWQPGAETMVAPSGAAFQLPVGAKIHLQIHYKKHFDQEQNSLSDKSTVGLYFTDPPPSGHELQAFAISPAANVPASNDSLSFGAVLPNAAQIVALRPMLDRAYRFVEIDAQTPSGATVPLLRLHGPRPQWFRRYWLQKPVKLATGSKIAVRVTPLADYSDEPMVTRKFPLQVVLDYVPL